MRRCTAFRRWRTLCCNRFPDRKNDIDEEMTSFETVFTK